MTDSYSFWRLFIEQ